MDAGRFESSRRPFQLHRAIRAVLQPIVVSTTARNLGLNISLDPRVDELQAQHSLWLTDPPQAAEDGLWVIGDELRLRQVLTNLTSNAVKFTPDGAGEIRVTSKLIEVRETDDTDARRAEIEEELEREMAHFETGGPSVPPHLMLGEKKISFGAESGRSGEKPSPIGKSNTPGGRQHVLVIRLEVQDCGPGGGCSQLRGSVWIRLTLTHSQTVRPNRQETIPALRAGE